MKATNKDSDNLISVLSGVKPDPGTILGRVRLVVREGVLRCGSQNALAKRLGVTGPAITGWMTKDSLDPGSSILGAISAVLGVNGDWLLTGRGDRYTAPADGGDALRQAGFEAGVAAAAAAVQAILVTSGGSGKAGVADRGAAAVRRTAAVRRPPPGRTAAGGRQ